MGYGRGPIPDGTLPVFSVETEQEARDLIVLTCPRNLAGEYVAPELAQEQTLENLDAFGDRLRTGYRLLMKLRGSAKKCRDCDNPAVPGGMWCRSCGRRRRI